MSVLMDVKSHNMPHSIPSKGSINVQPAQKHVQLATMLLPVKHASKVSTWPRTFLVSLTHHITW